MKRMILIIILASLVGGCSSKPKEINNTPQTTTTTTSTQSEDASQTSDTDIKVEDSLLKNIDETKSIFEKGYYDYAGTINNNINIQMSIYKSDKEVIGTYFYESKGEEIKLKGKSGGKDIVLYEYDGSGKNTGVFQGTMNTVDKIEGTWVSADNKTLYPFTLSLKSITSAQEYGKRYAIALNTKEDQDVENFAGEIQNYVVNGNKELLSEKIQYPINVKIDGKVVKVEDKDYFTQNYDKIINSRYKKAITNAFTKYMFVNAQGIMFGQNEYNLWINELTPTGGKAELMITAINN